MRKTAFFLIVVLLFVFAPVCSFAQIGEVFGKNKVVWEKTARNFYRSSHFDIYHSLDLNDPAQREVLAKIVNQLESSYVYLSVDFGHQLKTRISVVIFRTHSGFEANFIVGDEFMDEGVGAFAESSRRRLVDKLDFLPPLNDTIVTHELSHIFHYSFNSGLSGLAGRILRPRPLWFFEGMADYLANKFSPYTRDDIRNMPERVAAANPEKYLPTWEKLSEGQGNPYTMGAMFFEFIDAYVGIEKGREFRNECLADNSLSLEKALYIVSSGRIDSLQTFDRLNREYWKKKYALAALVAPDPYNDTDSVNGRSLAPYDFPQPIVSAVPSPDGSRLAGFSFQKNGLTLVAWPLPKEKNFQTFSQTQEGKKKNKNTDDEFGKQESDLKNLTSSMPPVPIEYPIVQNLETWTFNGSDHSWSPDGSKIALFARENQDHALFIVDSMKGKILKDIELPLDQAFSPDFDPTGETVYFSAAKNFKRDIYCVNLQTKEIKRITNDGVFASAPDVSPDGKKLVYIDFIGDFQKMFLFNLETKEKRQLTSGRYNDNSPSWSSDGTTIVYTSDEKDGVWNLYTLDLQSGKSKQWTSIFGDVFTPHFEGTNSCKVVYTAYYPYDQYRSHIYQNFKTFEAELKIPVREFIAKTDENFDYNWAFRPEKAIGERLDQNQLLNPEKPPKKWSISGSNVYLGTSTYWGMFGYAAMTASDILEEERYSAQVAMNGSFFRVLGMGYLNQRNRRAWGYQVSDLKIPLYYFAYDIVKGAPRQDVLKNTVSEEARVSAFTFYPLNKFNRLEGQLELRKRWFTVYGLDDVVLGDNDAQVMRFFNNSSGLNLVSSVAFVRDTVLYSQGVQGPLHGNALRIGVSFAPPMPGNSGKSFTELSFDARRYQRISDGVVFATRFTGLWSSDPNGDYVLMGGPDTLRGYVYGSMIGNQVAYASAELRFPFVDAVVFPMGMAVGPFRGFIFADGGFAKFSREKLAAQSGLSTGFGIQFQPFNFSWSFRKLDNFKDRKFDFYIGYNF